MTLGAGIAGILLCFPYYILPTYFLFAKKRPYQSIYRKVLIFCYMATPILIFMLFNYEDYLARSSQPLEGFLSILFMVTFFIPILLPMIYMMQKR